MCKLTVSINNLNIRSLKVTARICQNRSRMLSQTWPAGGYCKNTSEAVRTPSDFPNVTERLDPDAGSPINWEEGGLHHQVKAKVQHKENAIICLDNESLGRYPLFSALQGKIKSSRNQSFVCKTTRGLRLVSLVWTGWTTKSSHYNRTDCFFFLFFIN